MNIIILASALLFAFAISVGIKRYDKEARKAKEDFWEKERKSNFVRKKSLDNLNYISIPPTFYEIVYDTTDSKVKDAVDSLNHLKDCKIVNFSGITNTDLKLEYGTANLPILSEYDLNYTTMSRSLQVLAESLISHDDIVNAKSILLFLLDTGSDMKSTYKCICDIYYNEKDIEGINNLISKAESLDGLMRTSILEYINAQKSSLNSTDIV